MMIPTVIALLVIAALLFLAIRYIVIQKKKGVKCIGCPNAGSCSSSCGCSVSDRK